MKNFLGLSYLGSFASLGVGSCCVLPVALMLFGIGGSSYAIFAEIAAASFAVLMVSTAVMALAWAVAYRRRVLRRMAKWLAGSTALTSLAWALVLTAPQIRDYLITLM